MDRFLLQERMVQEGLHLHLEGRETSKTGRPLLHPFTQLMGRSQMGLCIAEGFLGIKVGINPRLYVRDRVRVDFLGSETLPFISSRHGELLRERRSPQGRR